MSIGRRLRLLEVQALTGRHPLQAYIDDVRTFAMLDGMNLSESEVLVEAERLWREGAPLTQEEWADFFGGPRAGRELTGD